MSSIIQMLVERYVSLEFRREFFIHLCLYWALSWGLGKDESIDWELLALGPKGSVPPPKPILWTFGYNRLVVFAFLALLCMAPRLYMSPKTIRAHGGDNWFRSKDWISGLVWVLIHHYSKMLFPLWGQWTLHIYTYFHISPSPVSLAGFECFLLSILGYLLALPPALIYSLYRVADTFIHPLIRSRSRPSHDSGILESERASVLWFLRLYVLLLIPERHFPNFSAAFAFWSIWVLVFCAVALSLSLAIWSLASKSHIRVLKVLPSLRASEVVECQLLQVELHGSRPSYDAISYHWQIPRKDASNDYEPQTRIIMINGFQYKVFPNVLSILKDVRNWVFPRYIWIDSICIDQGNIAEKEIQVAMMRQIYEGSSHVVIHLVEPEPPSRDVFQIRNMVSKLRDSRALQDFSYDDKPGELLSLGSYSDWAHMENFLDDPWFVRAWIVQEVTVAKQVRLRLRGQEVQWGDFVRACAVLSRTGTRCYIHYRYLLEGKPLPADAVVHSKMAGVESTLVLDNMREWYASGQLLPLLDTMILCLRFKSTWEVDKLYALLGVIDKEDRDQLGITPDYTRDKESIFKDLAYQLLQRASSIDEQFRILRFAGIGQARNMNGLPSWSPDWTAGLPTCPFVSRHYEFNYKASTKPGRRMRFWPPSKHPLTSNGVGAGVGAFLEVDGHVVDRIVLLCDISETPPPENTTDFPIRDALAAVMAHSSGRGKYCSTNQPIEEAFWRALIANPHLRRLPATHDIMQAWVLYFKGYEAARGGIEKAGAVPGGAQDDEAWDLRLIFSAIWFWQADDEDLRFAHVLATDLSRRWPEHRHTLRATSILNRPSDNMEATDVRMSAGRQFCVTEKGYFGLVPRLTAVDDMVVLFDGATTPHVVRPSHSETLNAATASRNDDIHCKLVGECFIHEGMDGQLGRDSDASKKTFVLE
ncbi:unnamed protein product [Clonostachys rosea]|uniref:Heterokaryon incompatibility domain-containing protein n=1 Tax=Bionectria ochroleuca TaxID=29856 RepID=A0ABY6UW61_BIOOC|nr:unnamed protein product [Clonostachys rosea]